MATRFEIERAVLVSGLDAGCRHLVHVLCVRIDAETGAILDAYQPSLTDLAWDTRRHRRTVQRYLNVLEAAGWITRKRPLPQLARREHARTAYSVHIPAGFTPRARGSTPRGARGAAPRAGGATPPGLGTQSPEARGPVPPRSSGSSGSSTGVIIEAIRDKTGITVSPEWARLVRGQILGARDDVRHPGAYLRRVIASAPPATYLPVPDVQAAGGPECEHGTPGGRDPGPAGLPRCPLCRQQQGKESHGTQIQDQDQRGRQD